MLKHRFSFNGRIRRLEYAVSLAVFLVLFVAINMMSLMGMKYYSNTAYLMLAQLPLFWFVLAQSSKRCHDLDRPGWWQVVPFYGLWLLLKGGQAHPNQYGNDPKNRS
jgi:uncharacterized membrane protein YhaH (DUF805 family)